MSARNPVYPTIEDRVRLAHAERSYFLGTVIGDGLATFAKSVASLFRGRRLAPSFASRPIRGCSPVRSRRMRLGTTSKIG